jgi:hypothetical protein
MVTIPFSQSFAQTTLSVSILDVDDQHPIEGLNLGIVHFTLYLDEEIVDAGDADDEAGGIYSYDSEKDVTEFDSWDIRLDPPPAWIEFPDPQNPNPSQQWSSSGTNQSWFIDDTNP